jgi:hypothetical protein
LIPPRRRLSSAACAAPAFIGSRVCDAVLDESCRAEAPVEYKTIRIVRGDKPSAASMSRATSSTLRICGRRRALRDAACHGAGSAASASSRRRTAGPPHAGGLSTGASSARIADTPGRSESGSDSVGRTLEVTGKLLDRVEIRQDRGGRDSYGAGALPA